MADVPTDLYRAYKNTRRNLGRGDNASKIDVFIDRDGSGSIRPNMGYVNRRTGRVRPADITTETGEGGAVFVPDAGDDSREGVSVSTSCGGFGYDGWCYFLLPEDTTIPEGLDIAHTPTRNDDGHYSIRCRNRMRMDAYEGALDNLARNAIAKSVEEGRTVLLFADPGGA